MSTKLSQLKDTILIVVRELEIVRLQIIEVQKTKTQLESELIYLKLRLESLQEELRVESDAQDFNSLLDWKREEQIEQLTTELPRLLKNL